MNLNRCFICGEKGIELLNTLDSMYECRCYICGYYKISKEAIEFLENFPYEYISKAYKLQSYIKEQNDEYNNIPDLNKNKITTIINMPEKSLKEQFNLLLLNLYKIRNAFFYIKEQQLENIRIKSWVKDFYILSKLFEKAYEERFLEGVNGSGYVLSNTKNIFIKRVKDFAFKGLEYVESLQQPNQNSKKIFLAFKFDDELNNIFKNDISDMLKILDLNPVIVNQDTTSHDEKISDKIISEIKSSRILIADLTHHSRNVYYEIGYAMGMGIPVILTCKNEEDSIKKVAFDINQYPVFGWKNRSELKEKIKNRIKVLL
jgi:nucleoside 2-deoxyribosyltransferase